MIVILEALAVEVKPISEDAGAPLAAQGNIAAGQTFESALRVGVVGKMSLLH